MLCVFFNKDFTLKKAKKEFGKFSTSNIEQINPSFDDKDPLTNQEELTKNIDQSKKDKLLETHNIEDLLSLGTETRLTTAEKKATTNHIKGIEDARAE